MLSKVKFMAVFLLIFTASVFHASPAEAAPYCSIPGWVQKNHTAYYAGGAIKACGTVHSQYVDYRTAKITFFADKWHDDWYDQSKVCIQYYNAYRWPEGWRQFESLCDTNSSRWDYVNGYLFVNVYPNSGTQHLYYRLAFYRWDGYSGSYIPVQPETWPQWQPLV